MRLWIRKKPAGPPPEVTKLLHDYKEALRLMREGDPMDEWIGMGLGADAIRDLKALGYDERGQRL